MKKNLLSFSALITLSLVAFCALSACTTTRPLGQVFTKPISEKIIKVPSDQSIEIIQKPTSEEPVIKFIVVTPTSEYILKQYEKIEKFEKTTSYKPLATVGYILAGLGIAYFLDNPVPDSSKYREDKFNDLSDEALANRKTGVTIAALGAVFAGIGMFTKAKITTIEKPVGVFEEKVSKNPQKIQFTFSISGTDMSEISGATSEKGEGLIKIDELLREYISAQSEFPEKAIISIKLEGDQNTRNDISIGIEETIAIVSHGKIDWRKGTPVKGLVPYLEAKAELTGTAKAGHAINIKIKVSNKEGKSDCYRLQAITKSDEPLFNNRRILIGYLKAGEEIQTEEKIEIPKDYKFKQKEKIYLSLTFKELNGYAPKPVDLEVIR